MAFVVMADDGIAFDGTTPSHSAIGGAEGAFIALAEALAARGHRVLVRNHCRGSLHEKGVSWTPLAEGGPDACDLFIANRGTRLLALVPHAARRVFWLHNPGQYLRKVRNLWPLLRYRPVMVFSGAYHQSTVPPWVPSGGRAIIPLGLAPEFREPQVRRPPPPRAIFVSNPLRGLDWLLDLWERRISRECPEAELDLYCGPQVYGAVSEVKAARMAKILARAESLAGKGVRRHAPLPRAGLISALREARVMLYRGDRGETFCLALAEAQALGLPAVIQPLGSVAERVEDGVTGAVAADEDTFVARALALLQDDGLWQRQHEAALTRQGGLPWDEVAKRFEEL